MINGYVYFLTSDMDLTSRGYSGGEQSWFQYHNSATDEVEAEDIAPPKGTQQSSSF